MKKKSHLIIAAFVLLAAIVVAESSFVVTYPNEYTRYYAGQLLEGQGQGEIDAITGASSSHGTFQQLAQAVLEQARKGDSSIMFVNTSH